MSVWSGIDATSPAPRDVWRKILRLDENALIFHTPEWLDALCTLDGYEDASRLYETPAGRTLVLPMVRRQYAGGLAFESSLPHGWGSGGLLAPGGLDVSDIAPILDDLAAQPTLSTLVRPNPVLGPVWAAAASPTRVVKVPARAHILDLDGGFDRVWSERFDATRRTNIRRAERSGLEVECDTSGKLVPVFYDIYLRWIERRAAERHLPVWLAYRLGRRRMPLSRLRLVAETLGESCRFWVASLHGRPVAASILLVYGANAVYWQGVSDREAAGSTRANDLLQKLMIENACHSSCRHYHMGESGGVATLERFKAQYGATVWPFCEYRFERFPLMRARRKGLSLRWK